HRVRHAGNADGAVAEEASSEATGAETGDAVPLAGPVVPPSQMPPLRLVRGDETGRITLPPPSWPAEGLETEPPVPLVGAPKPPSMSALDTPKTSSHRPPARARILIVDPQEDFRQLLRRVLEGKGYDAVEAHDGRAALEALEHTRVDLLLLDSHGPHMHGFELCQHLRASPQWHALPIIMVSALYRGWRFAADIEERYGVDAFLEKPFKVSDVVRAVRRALSDRGAATSASDEDQASIDPEAQSLLARSVEAYQRGQIDTAIELLRAGVGGHPTCFELHYHLALLFGRKDRLVDAIETLETAVELRPRDFSALKNLAILYQRAGFRHQAAEIWHRALLCAPDAATQEGIRAHLIQLF
ncbi:MAG: response regulator, partial [Polyangiales bacterium]